MSPPATVIADVRPAKRYRYSLYIGCLFGGIALLLGFFVLLPILHGSAARQTRFNQEAICRAKITYATNAVNAAQITDQSEAFKASIDAQLAGTKPDPDRVKVLGVEFTRDLKIATALAPIAAEAVAICHKNPNYSLPPEALNPGAP